MPFVGNVVLLVSLAHLLPLAATLRTRPDLPEFVRVVLCSELLLADRTTEPFVVVLLEVSGAQTLPN